jgi:predicted NBD/HSP70 family sugar kinase
MRTYQDDMPIQASHRVIPALNRTQVFNTLYERGSLTISDLVKYTDLSQLTVVKYLRELEEDNLVTRSGFLQPVIGRPAQMYSINPQGKLVVSIHFDPPVMQTALVNIKGKILRHKTYPIHNNGDTDEKLRLIVKTTSKLIEDSKKLSGDLLGIGIAIPGFFDIKTGVSLHIPRLQGWKDVPLGPMLEEKYGIPVMLIHDPNAMVLAEQEYGAGNEVSDFAYVFAGEGIAVGLVLDHTLIQPRYGGASGLLGHMTINLSEALDESHMFTASGFGGCIEQYASAKALYAKSVGNKDAGEKATPYDVVRDILIAYSKGSNEPVVDEAVRALGVGIANILSLLGLTSVILGGYPRYGGERIVKELESVIKSHSHPVVNDNLRLCLGEVENAGLVGAAIPFLRAITQPVSIVNSYATHQLGGGQKK